MSNLERCICGSIPILEERQALGPIPGLRFYRVSCDSCSNGLEVRRASAQEVKREELIESWNKRVKRARVVNPLGVHILENGKRCICSRCELLYRGYDVGRAEVFYYVRDESERRWSEDLHQVTCCIKDAVQKKERLE